MGTAALQPNRLSEPGLADRILSHEKTWHGVELAPGGSGLRNTILNRYVSSPDNAAN